MRMHVVVRGRVQGVGFRWFVREAARNAQLSGWVRNRQDGSVELEAEGAAGALDALRAAVARGPNGAHVSSVDDVPASAEPLAQPFTIIR
ncbi:MAG: acylphosphatase [Gemmatimonadaceae bacterium]